MVALKESSLEAGVADPSEGGNLVGVDLTSSSELFSCLSF